MVTVTMFGLGHVWAGGRPVMGTVNNIIKAGPPPPAWWILQRCSVEVKKAYLRYLGDDFVSDNVLICLAMCELSPQNR